MNSQKQGKLPVNTAAPTLTKKELRHRILSIVNTRRRVGEVALWRASAPRFLPWDAMVAELDIERPKGPWRDVLLEVARRYRGLAIKYPKAFSIVTRFQKPAAKSPPRAGVAPGASILKARCSSATAAHSRSSARGSTKCSSTAPPRSASKFASPAPSAASHSTAPA